ncbi:MAG: sigma 54-interacting transcriptional regulator, partial [Desulfobacterales bacterium]
MDQSKIVILEKSKTRRDYLRSIVSDRGHLPFIFEKANICLDNLLPLEPDLIISGSLPHDGMYQFVSMVKTMDGNLPVLIIPGDSSLNRLTTLNGFKDVKVFNKNFEPAGILVAISQLLRNRFPTTDTNKPGNPVIIGNSLELLLIKNRIKALSQFNEPILIQGEPGTGKELIARFIHHQTQPRNSPFVKVNLAEINPAQLDEFVSRVRQKDFYKSNPEGGDLYNPVDGGTLFLDKIESLPPLLQSRLLIVYEESSYNVDVVKQIGSNAVDMTMVVSSSKCLDELVGRGKLRKDLYYRMSVMSIDIPPLRKRISDIAPLTNYFSNQLCMAYDMCHIELSPKIMDCFCRYPWPGNVRELKTVVRRAVLYGDADTLIRDLWRQWAQNQRPVSSDQEIDKLAGFSNLRKYVRDRKNLSLKKTCSEYVMGTEKTIIKKALERTNWNRKKAAGLL